MTAAALALYVVAVVTLFGVRSWLHRRRTGSAGFHGISGTPADIAWWGGVLFAAAVIVGVCAPLLATTGTVPADAPTAVQVLGLALAVAGFLATLAGQAGMGASWRIGVDPAERTELVTSGIFAVVRNPIFTTMVAAQLGLLLVVPSWLSLLGLGCLTLAVQIQVRAVEEPYLRAVHGAAYRHYEASVGRFLPRVTDRRHVRVR